MVVLVYDMVSRFISKDLSTDELLSEYLLPRSSLAFDIPNFSELTKERVQRNNLFLNEIRSELDFKNYKQISSKDLAAIKIQKVYRGYVGRKKYFDILYESVQKSEVLSKQYQEQLAIESEALIDSYRIERELEDNDVIERNKLRFLNANASVIQRVWRKKKGLAKKEHICCFCNDEYYPSLYEYYSKTRKICFCCEKQKICHNEIVFSSKMTTMIDDSIVYDENISLTKYTLDEKATRNSFSEISDVLENNFDKNDKLKNCSKDEYSPDFFMVQSSLDDNDKCKRNKSELLNTILHSLKEKKYSNCWNPDFTNSEFFHCENLSLLDLHWVIDQLEHEVSNKSTILVNHLMIRDDLYTKRDLLLKGLDKLKKDVKILK